MTQTFSSRLKHAWNIFIGRNDIDNLITPSLGSFSTGGYRRSSSSYVGTERSIINAVYTRIAMDVASYDFAHVKVDADGKYLETIKSGLQNCLTIEANKDQTGRAFIQDVVMSMFDEGSVAIVPVDTIIPPKPSGAFEILTLRTAKIIEWFPDSIRVELYNDALGTLEQIVVPKRVVGIIENPLYAVMNEPNSTMQRLIQKLSLLDILDNDATSGKLDIIIQLPYVINSTKRQLQAENRKRAIEEQLASSKYGIVYTDGTERITQLNRPAENNLLEQVTFLTNMLYSQLGITEDVFTGKASAPALANYYDRSVEPIVNAILEELRRKFLTKTARSQGQTLMGFRDVFKLIPANEIAGIADTLSRNEIMTPNEFRSVLRLKPSKDKSSDKLKNRSMPDPIINKDSKGEQLNDSK